MEAIELYGEENEKLTQHKRDCQSAGKQVPALDTPQLDRRRNTTWYYCSTTFNRTPFTLFIYIKIVTYIVTCRI